MRREIDQAQFRGRELTERRLRHLLQRRNVLRFRIDLDGV